MIKLANYLESKEWATKLGPILKSKETKRLESFLTNELKAGRIFKPELKNVFRAFNITSPACQVVILGQDPYHTPGVADGLAFSSQRDVGSLPPSLRNILKEISFSIYHKHKAIRTGDLASWAEQGVLLLNLALTVGEKPLSHVGMGWENVVRRAIEIVVADEAPKVFLIWGKKAEEFCNKIPYIENRHLWLVAAHPSPLSARNGFFGCNHFNLANKFLAKHGRDMVSWGSVFKSNEETEALGSSDIKENERANG